VRSIGAELTGTTVRVHNDVGDNAVQADIDGRPPGRRR
jgi:hypothetical protein